MMLGQVVLYEFVVAEFSRLQLLGACLASIDIPTVTGGK